MSEVTWYVGGTVRSGSTLLSGLLAAATGGVNVGELHIFWRSFALGRTCTCGLALHRCPLWAQVIDLVLARTGLSSISAAAEVEAREPSQRKVALRGMHVDHGADLVELRRATVEAIREVAGCDVIVDSSKVASTLVVAVAGGEEVRAVHLVRDPRAVAYSMANPKRDPSLAGRPLPTAGPIRSSLRWLTTNLAFERLTNCGGITLERVRYEDFIAKPAETIRSLAGTEAHVITEAMSSRGEHAVAGNPWRFEPERRLRQDKRWEQSMAGPQAMLVTTTTLPGLLRYGYPVRRP